MFSLWVKDGAIQALDVVAGMYAPEFNHGLPTTSAGQLQTTQADPDHFSQGVAINGGACVDPVGAIDHHSNGGFPVTAEGRLCTSLGPMSYVEQGVPYDVEGRMVVAY